MQVRRSVATVYACACVAGALFACKNPTAAEAATCRSSLSRFTSPAPGVVTLTGQFYKTESILIYQFDDNTSSSASTLVASGTPATDRTTFTFTGLQSGVHYLLIKASCNNGQENLDEGDFTVS